MDSIKAKKLEDILKGRGFLDYTIIELINHGKSAAVFKAVSINNQLVAIKIFDDELIGRFGEDVQEKRISLERGLKNHNIPGLIKIIDGGYHIVDQINYFYIIMSFIEGVNLKEFIESNNYDSNFIKQVLGKLINVTEQLLNLNIVHRDIKPENIMVDLGNEIILMDLGVMKEVGHPTYTDIGERQFLGTLRYASPEFLLRTEEDSINGWRALNLYQIGAVLHDLIMKKPLFSDKEPYTQIVISIKEQAPVISNESIPFNLIQLVRNLLIKDWKKRLVMSPISEIKSIYSNEYENNLLENELNNLKEITNPVREKYEEFLAAKSTEKALREKRIQILESVILDIDNSFLYLIDKGIFNIYKKGAKFALNTKHMYANMTENELPANRIYQISGSLSQGFTRPFYMLFKIITDETSLVRIYLAGFFLNNSFDIDNVSGIFNEIESRGILRAGNFGNGSYSGDYIQIFNGVYNPDQQTREQIILQLIKVIRKAIDSISKEVKEEIDDLSLSKDKRSSRVRIISNPIIIIDRI